MAYDADRTIRFLKAAKALKKPILIGVMPLKSMKMARFMDLSPFFRQSRRRTDIPAL